MAGCPKGTFLTFPGQTLRIETEVNNSFGWFKSDIWGGNPEGASNVHLQASVPISKIIDYLTKIRFAALDDGDINSACLAIEENSTDLNVDLADVYLMARGNGSSYKRTRTVPNGGTIELFQGRGEDGQNPYVGDRKVHHPSRVTLQIHLLDIYPTKDRGKPAERQSVPVIAIHLPKQVHAWAKNILKQP
jgi:hypothetical protein